MDLKTIPLTMVDTVSHSSIDASDLHGFTPDAARASRLDGLVRAGLADSLRTVFDNLDEPADEARLKRLLDAIVAGPVRPSLFGTYVELVLAIFDERSNDTHKFADELLSQPTIAAEGFRIVGLDDNELGPGQADRYRRLVKDDVLLSIGPPSPQARGRAEAVLEAAFDLLLKGSPEMFHEVRALIREIVLIEGRSDLPGYKIGGATTFSLWGAQALVADHVADRLNTALVLAHEAAHCHLFGVAGGGRLVENSDEDRYPSPLRRDPRPMEGVAHATYVMARMVYALRRLIDSTQLTAVETATARAQVEENHRGFEQGMGTLLSDARFTAPGAAAFAHAQRYMRAQA